MQNARNHVEGHDWRRILQIGRRHCALGGFFELLALCQQTAQRSPGFMVVAMLCRVLQ